ncbi:FAD-dependent oxidoreductase [Segetibacter sp. 3557_3]|uniref:FAD-dependent oxidoreductase n=1 Tax=Segetibacter sp. 3557_3 TaxID=2547429 RepID=UPI001058D7DF|nr:FAD-dependent oxidoreductase [Segetibacter sp. 3557_3]TDH28532.1 FAD-dependent oxidoreductase [Segetibacter sp. 3557_3]
MIKPFITFCICLSWLAGYAQRTIETDVLVIGGGVGGSAAGIQSARMGVKTVLVESGPWLGGMISAAGVTATDGNHNLPSGLWAEFRNHVYNTYGGPTAVATGWVSNTQFEPHVSDSIFKLMAKNEKELTTLFNYSFTKLSTKANRITEVVFTSHKNGDKLIVKSKICIDATELGDVMKAAGVSYDLGMEAGSITGENVGIVTSNNIVQDLTYVAILKDYGAGTDHTIPKPAHYSPDEFDAACTDYYKDKSRQAPTVDAKKMLDYGKLPNGKYMLNWPGYGNDTYLNVVEMTDAERSNELEKAKQTTLRFVYFIQQQLGFKHLGLADDEFPTGDKLALMPYHREGRRLKGLVRMTMRHIAEPYTYGDALYRTGISVGDYPIDHHHKKNPAAPQHLEFYPIPSYNVPLGALIPQTIENLIVAEKGISVSNVVNGTTRLQPCVMLTGQAAGVLAALSSKQNGAPRKVAVRSVQQELLKAKAYIMPYIDVLPGNPHFEAVQKVGATGLLKGKGIPNKWANQTWFYADSVVNAKELLKALVDFKQSKAIFTDVNVSIREALDLAKRMSASRRTQNKEQWVPIGIELTRARWQEWGLTNFDEKRPITRLELAVLLNNTIDPFSMKGVNHNGVFAN